MSKVKFESSDAQAFEVDREVANMFVAIKNLMEDIGDDTNAIPLPNVTGEILKRVIEWCEYHIAHPKPDEKRDSKEIYEYQWDKTFCNTIDHTTLFELVLAANYLDIKGLLDVTCKTVANMIRAKTPDEIKAYFKLTQDFTPEEEEMIRNNNEWCEIREN
ncbi:hypothetical protein PPL_02203 [Heterostelium album PN500]|uniref:Uncharacterized protein n=1 Tax=Heterostelium pallidum (strain ATCC 26659 / Pp 5 / PN500) TaxID=670386 RepID=D3B1M9_HETP5|nr:hypothetical protein PPL_02203 [Heterostelium album PN500]EFA85203.1 hypothetical protein PPL_02203 [Heterostelium album PN500]|eukprot:XP_020437312.1 hypothetical protein PPL_02203 [Heterostelium album PN500]